MPTRQRALLILLTLCLLAVGSFGAALMAGSLRVPPGEVLGALFGQGQDSAEIVLQLRLPRAIAAFACGGLLALAGALMQVLLRNPLADPYVLGISGGAGVGAMFALMLGLPVLAVDSLSFAGALGAMFIVFGLAHGDGSWTQTRLLLTGVIVAAGCGALVALMLAIADENRLRGMLFWLMGDLGQSTQWWPALLALGVGLALAMPVARELNLLARGQMQAQARAFSVLPEIAMNPAAAYQKLVAGEIERIAVDSAAGRIAATGLVPYPPGIPMVMPGECLGGLEEPFLAYLRAIQDWDRKFPGFAHDTHGIESDGSVYKLLVLR